MTADHLMLAGPRERDLWTTVAAAHGIHCCADVSQSIDRCGARDDGTIPTITPGSEIAAAALQRIISPSEKMILHALPVHKMLFPASATACQIGQLGGNTMHCMVVAAITQISLAFVNWRTAPPTANAADLGSAATGLGQPKLAGSVLTKARGQVKKTTGKNATVRRTSIMKPKGKAKAKAKADNLQKAAAVKTVKRPKAEVQPNIIDQKSRSRWGF